MFVKISLRENTTTEGLLMLFCRERTCTRRIQLISWVTLIYGGNFYQVIYHGCGTDPKACHLNADEHALTPANQGILNNNAFLLT